MIGNGEFNPNIPLHRQVNIVNNNRIFYLLLYRHCIGFVYEQLIENCLKDFMNRWNMHRIRKNRLAGCPSGVGLSLLCWNKFGNNRSTFFTRISPE